jgi:hypothetical protein
MAVRMPMFRQTFWGSMPWELRYRSPVGRQIDTWRKKGTRERGKEGGIEG